MDKGEQLLNFLYKKQKKKKTPRDGRQISPGIENIEIFINSLLVYQYR